MNIPNKFLNLVHKYTGDGKIINPVLEQEFNNIIADVKYTFNESSFVKIQAYFINKLLKQLIASNSQRLTILHQINEGICRYCGSLEEPCNCKKD